MADKDKSLGPGLTATLLKLSSKRDRVLYGTALLASAGSGVVLPLMTLIFGKFVSVFNDFALGKVSDSHMLSQIGHYALYFVYLFVAKAGLSYISMVLFTIVSTRLTSRLQQLYLHTILRQTISFHDTTLRSGAVSEALGNHSNAIRSGLADKMGLAAQHSASVITAFVVAIASIWNLALAVASAIPASVVVIGVVSVFDEKMESQINSLKEEASTIANEVFGSIRTVRSLNATDKLTQRYRSLLDKVARIGWKRASWQGLQVGTYMFMLYGAYALAFWYGIRLYAGGSVGQPGKVITTLFSIMIGVNSFSQLAAYLGGFMSIFSSGRELLNVINVAVPELEDDKDRVRPDEGATLQNGLNGDIVLQDVTFRYPSRPTTAVLQSLFMTILGGKQTAFVGASGCGKSTIVGLLLRWYNPESGNITVGGRDISDMETKSLRAHIGFVQQEPRLFSGTVLENLQFGLLGTPAESLPAEDQRRLAVEAAQVAYAHDFILELPQGYDTFIGERGTQLSGGQKQRLAIARAVIKNPSILILDEATSALDMTSEALVQRAIENASQNRTTIYIAHRLSTITHADQIIVLGKGGVLEMGTHESLIAKEDGLYMRLWAVQSAQKVSKKHMNSVGGIASTESTSPRDSDEWTTKESPIDPEKALGEPKVKKMGTFRTMYSIMGQYKSNWVAYVGLIGCALFPAQAILYARAIHAFQLTNAAIYSAANFWGLMWFIVAIVVSVGYFGLAALGYGLGENVSQDYRSLYFKSLSLQSVEFFDDPSNGIGKLTSRLSTEPESIHSLAGGNLSVLITVSVCIISTVILALAVGWKYALVVLAGGLPVIFAANFIRERMENTFQERTDKVFTDCIAYASECVGSIRTIASLNMEDFVENKFAGLLTAHCDHAKQYAFRAMALFALSESVDLLCMALAFWYGGTLLVKDHYSTDQFFIVFVAIVFGSQSAGSYFAHSSDITKGVSAVNTINAMELASREQSNETKPGSKPVIDNLDTETPIFEFRDVDFSYPARKDCRILKGLNIKLMPGQFAAVVGDSGSGKSTITQLVERFYEPDRGEILLNGMHLHEQACDDVRRLFAMVSQEPAIFQGTIKDNLLLGTDDDGTAAEMDDILQASQLTDLVKSMPEGEQTQISGQGTSLSGGQKQRIAIARALFRDSPVLLLDEATSALDSETESLIQENLIQQVRGRPGERRAILAIAHRLSTVRDADVIYVMQQGRVVERGNHTELLDRRGVYFNMWRAMDKEMYL